MARRWKYVYWFVANSSEGCGHRHLSKQGAYKCANRLAKRGAKMRVYKVSTTKD